MKNDRRGTMPLLLMYHSVAPYDEDPYDVTVSPSRFGQQMHWLARRGLRGTSVAELLDARREGRDRGLVGLTFDDGYADFLSHVSPVLHRFGFTATVFVVAGRLGETNVWDPDGPTKPLLTAGQVRDVAASGMEIGSHAYDHVRLVDAPPAVLGDHLVRSRSVLEDVTGGTVRGFCYPYGALCGAVVDQVGAAGYDYGCAIWASRHTGRHALPRTLVHDGDHALRLDLKRARHLAVAQGLRAGLFGRPAERSDHR